MMAGKKKKLMRRGLEKSRAIELGDMMDRIRVSNEQRTRTIVDMTKKIFAATSGIPMRADVRRVAVNAKKARAMAL
ncbi:hypothetical protein FGB62_1g011 [Gracilaria domingensis]|nr:hypothetical protein FGB62_1g011 [Gracilaria domingensis]